MRWGETTLDSDTLIPSLSDTSLTSTNASAGATNCPRDREMPSLASPGVAITDAEFPRPDIHGACQARTSVTVSPPRLPDRDESRRPLPRTGVASATFFARRQHGSGPWLAFVGNNASAVCTAPAGSIDGRTAPQRSGMDAPWSRDRMLRRPLAVPGRLGILVLSSSANARM